MMCFCKKRALLVLAVWLLVFSAGSMADISGGDRGLNFSGQLVGQVYRVDLKGYVVVEDILFAVPRRAKLLDVNQQPMALRALRKGDRVALSYDKRGSPKKILRMRRLPESSS